MLREIGGVGTAQEKQETGNAAPHPHPENGCMGRKPRGFLGLVQKRVRIQSTTMRIL